jgi:hypothetical protein
VRRTLSTTGLVIGAAWSLLMLLALGQGLADGDATVIVYATSALLVSGWGVWLSVRRRRGQVDRDWLPVVACTVASLLGPLAFLLLAARRVRALVFERVPRSEPPAVEPSSASPVYVPGQTATEPEPEPTVYGPSSAYVRPRAPRSPTRTLIGHLILAVLAFLVVGVAVIGYIGFGTGVLTPHVMRNIALGSAAVGGAAILLAAYLWFSTMSRARDEASRRPGAVMIGVAATLVAGATVYFATLTSPRSVVRPSVSGSPRVDAMLTADPGRWNEANASLFLSYQWQRCDKSCNTIFGATAPTYVVEKADLGKRIRVAVEANPRSPGWHELAAGLAYSSETGRVTR